MEDLYSVWCHTRTEYQPGYCHAAGRVVIEKDRYSAWASIGQAMRSMIRLAVLEVQSPSRSSTLIYTPTVSTLVGMTAAESYRIYRESDGCLFATVVRVWYVSGPNGRVQGNNPTVLPLARVKRQP